MKGEKKKRASDTGTRKQRILLFVILAAVILISIALFISNTRKPLPPEPSRFGYLRSHSHSVFAGGL
jgi:hypothetical protein